jgi:pimeloyl-ACP methyl ester carboxylesterase
MPRAHTNGIEIEYETFGPHPFDGGGEPLLLIMGLGTQMLGWTEEFCEHLVRRGHFVIRYDNRDVGLSTKFDDSEHDRPLEALAKATQGQPVKTAYELRDMAADAAGLLAALDLPRAHVAGASMGGMIAQALTIDFPERVASLTSIMSHTGEPGLGRPTPEAMEVLMTPAPAEREAVIAQALRTWRVIGSPGFPFDAERIRQRAGRSYDRCHHPAGGERQLVAIAASGSRREALERLRTPTLVIHGEDDPLVPVEGGHATLEAVPDAQGLFIPGMGHDMPVELYETLTDAISEHAHAHPLS